MPTGNERSFVDRYPHIQRWIDAGGNIELGSDGYLFSSGRLMWRDELVAETNDGCDTIDQALDQLDRMARDHPYIRKMQT